MFIDGTAVNVALPALARDLDASLGDQQWVVDAYLLALGTLLLVGGWLGDVYGRRRIMRVGLVLFALTSLGVALSPTTDVLVAARALQGVAGAVLVPGSLALLRTAFDDERERRRAVATWITGANGATLVGPLVGALLVDLVSWRAVFMLNVPILAVAFAACRTLPESRDPRPRSLDRAGAALGVAAVGLPVYALIEAPHRGVDERVGGALLLGVAAAVAFVVVERRAADPMLPFGLFRSRAFTLLNLYTLTLFAGFGGTFFFVALYAQGALGYSALAAGLVVLPTTLSLLLLSRPFAALADRVGSRTLLCAGPLACAAGMVVLTEARAGAYVETLLVGGVILGVGAAACFGQLTAAVLDAVPARHAGIASGVNNAVTRLAILLAVAALGALASVEFRRSLPEPVARGTDAPLLAEAALTPFAAPDRRLGAASAEVVAAAGRRSYRLALAGAAVLALLASALALGLRRAGPSADAVSPPRPG